MTRDEQQVWADRQVRIIDDEPLAVLQQLVGSDDSISTLPPLPPPSAPAEPSLDVQLRASLSRQLAIHQGNVMHLQEQAAGYGSLDVPLRILNEIDVEERKITDLKRQLGLEL